MAPATENKSDRLPIIGGMTLGLVSSVGLALIGPAYLGANALWPLVNPTPCRSESSVRGWQPVGWTRRRTRKAFWRSYVPDPDRRQIESVVNAHCDVKQRAVEAKRERRECRSKA